MLVLENLASQRDVARLCRVNRKLYDAVSPVLYKNAVDRHDMWPLAFAAFSGNTKTMKKILAAGADPNWLFDDVNMPIEAAALLEEPGLVRVPPLQNAPFGRPSRSMQAHLGHHLFDDGSPSYTASSYMHDDDVDEDGFEEADFEDDGSLTTGQLDVWGWNPWTDLPLAEYSAGAYQDDLEDDDELDDHHPIPGTFPGLGSTGSSTLGSSELPQNGAERAQRSPFSQFFATLHLAAAMGNAEAVELLLDHGASIDSSSQGLCRCRHAVGMLNNVESHQDELSLPQWTPLHMAICFNRPETAMLLLRRGADCMMEGSHPSGLPDHYDSTALHHAAALGQADLVRYLVDNGHQTDVDVRDRRTLTPFYYAYANSRWDSTAPLLLQMGADINVEIKFYQPYCTITPLGEAVRLGNFGEAQKLLDLGADHSRGFVATGAGHRKGLSPLHLACMLSAHPRGASRKLFDEGEKAAQRINIMKSFIAKGADIHSTDCYGDTPLISAAQNLILPSVRALIAAGADVNARNPLGRTALMQAALGPEPFQASLDASSESRSDTPRLLSQILTEMVRAGARMDDVDPRGNNILHILLDYGRFWRTPAIEDLADTIGLVLTHRGADALLTTRNKKGQLAFELAFYAEAYGAYDVFLRTGLVQRVLTSDDVQRMCSFVMVRGNMSSGNVKLLLDLDFDGKLLSWPALFDEAVTSGSWSVVTLMANRVIPTLDQKTCTRLMWHALDAYCWDIACQLIDAGADVRRGRDGTASTPLGLVIDLMFDVSMSGESLPRVEGLVRLLIEKGANIHDCVCASSRSRLLTAAMEKSHGSLLPIMLRAQPLRDDPRAVGGYYLHDALRLEQPSYHQLFRYDVVYALIHSGADLTELNEDGDCPLAVFLRALCVLVPRGVDTGIHFSQCCDLFRDLLVPGMQIIKPNKQGRSIADYLQEFLQTKIGQQRLAPILDLDADDASVLRFKPDLRLRRMPDERPVATIWDSANLLR